MVLGDSGQHVVFTLGAFGSEGARKLLDGAFYDYTVTREALFPVEELEALGLDTARRDAAFQDGWKHSGLMVVSGAVVGDGRREGTVTVRVDSIVGAMRPRTYAVEPLTADLARMAREGCPDALAH